eukprot:TRINITY_DN40678_c0_g1_i3.p1 TRINITY_DN40678_c0_g1~~TRINITY_DN40678_c0_g1_i3.p1  ORF type:complete len:292 (+),score=59.11 TRINITY_DN40678_c0_g1_i3:49-924(+)
MRLAVVAAAAVVGTCVEHARSQPMFTGFDEPDAKKTLLAQGFDDRTIKDLELLDDAYNGYFFKTASRMMSSNLKTERERIEGNAGELAEAAGEMQPVRVWQFLQQLGFPRGTRFYDLGGGAGKISAIAWMLGLNATGLELSEGRVHEACRAYKHLQQATSGSVAMKNADFLRYDWSDADVVYSNSIMFNEDIMKGMAGIAAGMREGTLIISGHAFPNPIGGPKLFKTLKEIVIPEIQEIDLNLVIQERVGPPTGARPTCLGQEEGVECSWTPEIFSCSTDDATPAYSRNEL